jgi:3-hydroxyisobutyrate dehydrogenase-like beta-hydroxyacid dehydrogenase
MFIAPKMTHETSIAVLGLGELGQAIAMALQSDGF